MQNGSDAGLYAQFFDVREHKANLTRLLASDRCTRKTRAVEAYNSCALYS